ncbi:hypothetical protein MP478_06860 [Chryseobacterium sp. WG14]|uniref:hypothetical protein n=1 Tax=unclassified Chryseobacterium TaxID=2593645 RepID=UPI00211DC146|nr:MULTISPECIES: hypothetical protein [unclassified Chryseobacterium]MCQ9633702.1 hypothetical protein [Chryseobacterium sp. WG23]MCQ9639109.1 hypothetical protein [Chryseobacterium sp. WG14]
MRNKIQILTALLFVVAFSAVANIAQAQTTDHNTIQEIQLNKSETFNDIRSQLIANFDLTKPEYRQGTVNSVVKFDIAKNGKIVNVHSSGDCKSVSKEIENVLSELDYRVDRKKISDNMVAYTYVMPVTVEINNR